MKKLLYPLAAVILMAPALAFVPVTGSIFLSNFAVLILGIETFFVILISANLVKFLNITKRNHFVRLIYIIIGLFLFNSVMNLMYFLFNNMGWYTDYMYIYLIERITITIAFLIILWGFYKFNKLLRVKVKI